MLWYECPFFSSNHALIFISPGCRVIIEKISGCDWIQCTQCKLEICVCKIWFFLGDFFGDFHSVANTRSSLGSQRSWWYIRWLSLPCRQRQTLRSQLSELSLIENLFFSDEIKKNLRFDRVERNERKPLNFFIQLKISSIECFFWLNFNRINTPDNNQSSCFYSKEIQRCKFDRTISEDFIRFFLGLLHLLVFKLNNHNRIIVHWITVLISYPVRKSIVNGIIKMICVVVKIHIIQFWRIFVC